MKTAGVAIAFLLAVYLAALLAACGGGEDGGETTVQPSPAPTEGSATPLMGKIAFASTRDVNWEVYVMSADGSDQTNLTDNPALDDDPNWSPDGRRIAFNSRRDGNWEVYIMDADGSGQTNLTNNPAGDAFPAWSP